VVALGEQQFDDLPAVGEQAVRIRGDDQPLAGWCDAGRVQLRRSGDLDQAQAAAGVLRQAVIVTQRRNTDAVLTRDIEDGLVFRRLSGCGRS
jgi:hypothetical protein